MGGWCSGYCSRGADGGSEFQAVPGCSEHSVEIGSGVSGNSHKDVLENSLQGRFKIASNTGSSFDSLRSLRAGFRLRRRICKQILRLRSG